MEKQKKKKNLDKPAEPVNGRRTYACTPPLVRAALHQLRHISAARSAHARRRSLGRPSTRSACQAMLHWIYLSWPPRAPPQSDLPLPSAVTIKRGLPERCRSRIQLPACHHCQDLSPTRYCHRTGPRCAARGRRESPR